MQFKNESTEESHIPRIDIYFAISSKGYLIRLYGKGGSFMAQLQYEGKDTSSGVEQLLRQVNAPQVLIDRANEHYNHNSHMSTFFIRGNK